MFIKYRSFCHVLNLCAKIRHISSKVFNVAESDNFQQRVAKIICPLFLQKRNLKGGFFVLKFSDLSDGNI